MTANFRQLIFIGALIMKKQRISLITGGTGGIGTAICRELASKGHKVIAGYNKGGNHSAAEAWQKKQRDDGFDIHIAYGDVADYDSAKELINAIKKEHGPIDILINNAGIASDATLRKMDIDKWRSVMSTNLDSIYHVTSYVIHDMCDNGFGRIINISSINGQKGQFGQTNYSAAKAGMHGFTKALALEVAKKGVTVNTVSPGYVNTEMMAAVPENVLNEIVAQIPVGRLGHPEEIARTVGFLIEEGSGFITGSNICINGGQYMA